MDRPTSARAGVVPALDGIRALAITLVILWHCAASTGFPPSALGWLRPVVLMGWSGVDLFFALSGLLITRLLLAEEEATGRIDLVRFYARRSLRIFPAYYLVLALNLGLLRGLASFPSAAGAGSTGPLELVALATYWSNYFYAYVQRVSPAPSVGIYWSLCVEEHFYLLWPVLLLLVRSPRARVALAAGVCAGVPLLRWVAGGAESRSLIHSVSHYRLDAILWGCLCALIAAGPWAPSPAARRSGLLLLAVSIGAATAAGQIGAASDAGYSIGLSALAAGGALLALEAVSAPHTLLARGLSLPPLRAMGRVSYGMYLLHFQALDLVRPVVVDHYPVASPAAFLALAGATTVGTFLAATLLYVLWERPFLRLKQRFEPVRAEP